jgi:tetratricopeptide (TPR) repeat protein
MGAAVCITIRSSVSLFVVVVVAAVLATSPVAAAAGGGASAHPCALADALARDGEREAAHAQYLKVIEATNQDIPCADVGLMATQPPSKTSVSSTLGDIAKGVGYAVGVIVFALLLLVVAALVWLQLQTRTPWLRDRWPAHRIRRPLFSVEALTDTGTDPVGSAVAGLIRGRVTWTTDRFGLNLVSGQAGVATAFSGLGDISSEAKAAVAVIEFLTALLPRRRFQLTGQLQPPGEEGVGISLELSQNGNAEALTSLWAASFHITDAPNDTSAPNASAYQHLAVASAAWVDIWMTKALDGGALLTADPVSWAFFRSGVDAQRLGDRERAQVLYEQALAADGTNVGAMANLGIICRRARRYEDARDYLERALEPTQGASMAPHLQPDENPDWYRIKYQIAALYTNWAVESEGIKKDDRSRRASTEARSVAETTLDTLARLERGGRGQGKASRAYLQDTLLPFLTGTIEPSVLALLAGTVCPLPERPDGWPPHERPSREDVRASLAANAADPSNTLDPWQLIAFVERGPNRPPETQFNLACFYTRAGDLTMASRRLLHAVRETQRQERQRLVDVALLDPVLKPLLDKRPGLKAKLYEMVDATAPFPDVDELVRHFERQDRTISHFQSLGYSVMWNVDTNDIDLTASKGSQVLLIKTPGPEPTRDPVGSVSTIVRSFEKEHPDAKHVKTSMVLSAIDDYPPDALASARDRGMEVLIDTGHGFKPLDADQG